MDEWTLMFAQVRSIMQSSQTLQQSIKLVVKFARSNPQVFDEPEFWNAVERYDFQPDFAVLTRWTKEGFEALEPEIGWQLLLLDLGDCPETFRLYKPGGQQLMLEQQFRNILLGELVVSVSDLDTCFKAGVSSPFNQLFGSDRKDLCDHSVSELPNSILNWTGDDRYDYHGNNGYLIWLMLGSLALVEPLKDKDFFKAVLKGRDRLYLMAGYEEIFFHAATVTSEGILFSTAG